GVGRSHREAPEIDGIISLPTEVPVGALVDVVITGAEGPDLQAVPATRGVPAARGVPASATGRTAAPVEVAVAEGAR
ncbi:MAG: hypothetical protein M3Y91_19190, partial [Actinomycetota bacterium]|nr:hypothetical protein [Actinomycetota bacterium]